MLMSVVIIDGVVAQLQRLTVPLVDTFIADLKDSVEDAKTTPGEKGNMVQVYGMWFYQLCFLYESPLLH